ncbi:hypothetical protein L873DRAFT_1848884 [Choiromyces venosus 120613-1]|uniref:Uncharacterized protein n=1 Tax=Choiromyces venosus 120613-1 TaxID=1336337 RepID=A0A3N4IZ55_9PEZI|nr:hypothetical protein L873DRAFT_1848884 [Choiromyces venosus 120613-1]
MDITITTVLTGSVAMMGQSLPTPKCGETSEGVKIRTIDTLQTSGDNTLLFIHQYTVMEELLDQRPELEAMISPGDRFFMDFHMKQMVRDADFLPALVVGYSVLDCVTFKPLQWARPVNTLSQISTAHPAHSSMDGKANTVQLHVLLRLMLGFRLKKRVEPQCSTKWKIRVRKNDIWLFKLKILGVLALFT